MSSIRFWDFSQKSIPRIFSEYVNVKNIDATIRTMRGGVSDERVEISAKKPMKGGKPIIDKTDTAIAMVSVIEFRDIVEICLIPVFFLIERADKNKDDLASECIKRKYGRMSGTDARMIAASPI